MTHRFIKCLVAFSFLSGACFTASGQVRKSEKIEKTLQFTGSSAANTLLVYNVWGPITVEGYEGNEVRVVVQKTVDAKTQVDTDRGMEEVDLGIWQRGDSIALYANNKRLTHFEVRRGHVDYSFYDCCRDNRDPGYTATFSFVVKVPFNTRLGVQTVLEGAVKLKGVHHITHASNVNGPVMIDGALDVGEATTVNGDVNVTYDVQGKPGGEFRTINGDINLTFRQDPDAVVTFKSMNGGLYTNAQKISLLPPEVKKTETSDNGSTIYKIEKLTPVQLGAGGGRMILETLNGDVVIKKG